MKKVLFIGLALMAFVAFGIGITPKSAHAAHGDDEMIIKTVLDAVAISASGSTTSDPISIGELSPAGFFSVEILTAGVGSAVTIEYELSYDAVNWSDCGTDIKTGHAPGRMIYGFPDGEPLIAPYIRFKVTETAGNAVSSCTLKLGLQ